MLGCDLARLGLKIEASPTDSAICWIHKQRSFHSRQMFVDSWHREPYHSNLLCRVSNHANTAAYMDCIARRYRKAGWGAEGYDGGPAYNCRAQQSPSFSKSCFPCIFAMDGRTAQSINQSINFKVCSGSSTDPSDYIRILVMIKTHYGVKIYVTLSKESNIVAISQECCNSVRWVAD